eukprot:1283626-Amphidinium_carterae.1
MELMQGKLPRDRVSLVSRSLIVCWLPKDSSTFCRFALWDLAQDLEAGIQQVESTIQSYQ